MTADRSESSFALCLTHDVDRLYKGPVHVLYETLQERDPRILRQLFSEENPYWQFDTVRELESNLGVRSAFYLLCDPPLHRRSMRSLLNLDTWVQACGRYDITDPEVEDTLQKLAADGWEIGLHGSLGTARDREQLAKEKALIERVTGVAVRGGRQHFLDVDVPETFRHYRALGLDYDASLGLSTDWGFAHGYDVQYPFDDEFAVFPLTLMESALPDPGSSFDRAWSVCQSLLEEAAANEAVMTVLWHPRFFATEEFPGYRRLYRQLVETALDMGAWVGPPGSYYEEFLEETRVPENQKTR